MTDHDARIGTADVSYVKNGRVAVVSITRPERRNTINSRIAVEMYEVLEHASRDRDLAVIVLRGEGADFCAGADVVPEAEAERGPGDIDLRQFDVAKLLYGMRPITIAAVRGGCAGAGMGWACCCDFRIADTTAKFNTAFLDVGVAGDMGLPWTLGRMLGSSVARELCFFPRKIGAREAREVGLVTRLFEEDAFEAELETMTQRLAAAAPLALATLKENFLAAENGSFEATVDVEGVRHVRLFYSKDRSEAFAAYLEKRQPVYQGC